MRGQEHAPREHDHRRPVRRLGGERAHRVRDLPVDRLGVERPLARDHEVGAGDLLRQPDRLRDEACARLELGAEDPDHRRGHPARRAGARELRHVEARLLDEHARPAPQRRVEERHVGLLGALLRAEHVRRATLAVQRVGHVDREPPPHLARPRVQAREVEARDPREPLSAVGHLLALLVEEPRAEPREDACTAVGRRRPAEAHDHLVHPGVEHGRGRRARAARVGVQRLQRDVAHLRQSARLRELHDPEPAVARDAVARRAGAADRVDRLDLARGDAPDGEERVEGALAAVGHGQLDDLGVGDDAAHARGDGVRDVGGTQAALEGVGRDDDAQRAVGATRDDGGRVGARR